MISDDDLTKEVIKIGRKKRQRRGRCMNIIDAVKSGKNFARKPKGKNDFHLNCKSQEYVLDIDDILATDWEIEERKIEITESEFDMAISISGDYQSRDNFIFELKKRLFGK